MLRKVQVLSLSYLEQWNISSRQRFPRAGRKMRGNHEHERTSHQNIRTFTIWQEFSIWHASLILRILPLDNYIWNLYEITSAWEFRVRYTNKRLNKHLGFFLLFTFFLLLGIECKGKCKKKINYIYHLQWPLFL